MEVHKNANDVALEKIANTTPVLIVKAIHSLNNSNQQHVDASGTSTEFIIFNKSKESANIL